MSTTAIQEEIRSYATLGHIPSSTSQAALWEMARRWVKIEGRKIEREAVRSLEAKATPVSPGTVAKMRTLALSIVSTASQEWGDILDLSFRLPGGEVLAWGDASPEQHETCAEAIEYAAAGSVETAARHRMAAGVIRRAQASTLRDVA